MGGSTHMGGVGMVKQRWVWYHTLSTAGKTLPSPYRVLVVVIRYRRYRCRASRRRRRRALSSSCVVVVVVRRCCCRCRGFWGPAGLLGGCRGFVVRVVVYSHI